MDGCVKMHTQTLVQSLRWDCWFAELNNGISDESNGELIEWP